MIIHWIPLVIVIGSESAIAYDVLCQNPIHTHLPRYCQVSYVNTARNGATDERLNPKIEPLGVRRTTHLFLSSRLALSSFTMFGEQCDSRRATGRFSSTVDDFETVRAAELNRALQLSTRGLQQLQKQSLRNCKILQLSGTLKIWFGTRRLAI
jgi:hypothetical protein